MTYSIRSCLDVEASAKWEFAGVSPLAETVEAAHKLLTPLHEFNLLKALRRFESGAIPFSLGTGCSGTDVTVKIFQLMISFWAFKYGIDLTDKFDHKFSCEMVPFKQRFIQAQFQKLGVIFGLLKDLEGDRATNLLTNTTVVIASVLIYMAGFVCKARSPANKNAKANKGCCERGNTVTGESLHSCRKYIVRHGVLLFILENVPTLLEENDPDANLAHKSDAEYIKAVFAEDGYTVGWVERDAVEFGSITTRRRLCFLGHKGIDKSGETMAFLRSVVSKLTGRLPNHPQERFYQSFTTLCSSQMRTGLRSFAHETQNVL